MPEYLDFRCCMCPNGYSSPQNTVCPAFEPFKKLETPCRFVKTYIDGRGCLVFVARGSRKTEIGVTPWVVVRRETEHAAACRIRSSMLPARNSLDAAQSDLNKYAKLKGWREVI